jgi:hypothetical protein
MMMMMMTWCCYFFILSRALSSSLARSLRLLHSPVISWKNMLCHKIKKLIFYYQNSLMINKLYIWSFYIYVCLYVGKNELKIYIFCLFVDFFSFGNDFFRLLSGLINKRRVVWSPDFFYTFYTVWHVWLNRKYMDF